MERNPLRGGYPNPTAAVTADVGNSSPSSSGRSVRAERPIIVGPFDLSHDESLTYARRFFKWGFFCLPFLWAVNYFYFWPAFRQPHSRHSDPLLRRYLLGLQLVFWCSRLFYPLEPLVSPLEGSFCLAMFGIIWFGVAFIH